MPFGGMWILSALSGRDLGGYGILGFWSAVVVTAAWSLVVIELAKRSSLPAEETGRSDPNRTYGVVGS